MFPAFRTARFKLTVWYVAIVMLVSLAFSIGVYTILRREVMRFSQLQRVRFEQVWQGRVLLLNTGTPNAAFVTRPTPPPTPPDFDTDTFEAETLERIRLSLLGVNAGILVVATALCYILAGSTLAPLEKMVEEQRRFIGDASHELKTPLTALRTTLEVALRNPKLTLKEAKTLMQENVEEVAALAKLNDALLSLDTYRDHVSAKLFVPVSLDTAVTSAMKKTTPLAKQQKITVQTHIEPLTVNGDLTQLTELMVILLDNAVKYSKAQSTITVTAHKDHNQAIVQVIDSGLGISPEQLPHIFDRFYRADASRTKNTVAGYGLGLAIAKQIVETHNGQLTAKSELGHGSTFTVTLPSANFQSA